MQEAACSSRVNITSSSTDLCLLGCLHNLDKAHVDLVWKHGADYHRYAVVGEVSGSAFVNGKSKPILLIVVEEGTGNNTGITRLSQYDKARGGDGAWRDGDALAVAVEVRARRLLTVADRRD